MWLQTRIESSKSLSNLVNNSLKFTKNGRITITAEIDKKCYNHKVIHQIIVRVKDTGIGIDLDILPQLFSKFVTKSNDVVVVLVLDYTYARE